MPRLDLPPPDATARELSHALAARIVAEIDAAGGWLDFERYMQRCLYEPGLGYYSAGSVKFGAAGDFVTAPEISPLFGRAVAGFLAPGLARLEDAVILEIGAGSGALAATVLERLEALGSFPAEYRILEVSADLRDRQRARLKRWGSAVRWLDAPPQNPFEGFMLANEVVDALPVARFTKRQGAIRPLGVALRKGQLGWALGPLDPALAAAVEAIETARGAPLAESYTSEWRRCLPEWLAAVAAPLARGALLVIDYGLPRREYYHAQRAAGTLTCHYRHRAHDDPFLWPGLQDLTAWVDFSQLAGAALDCGLKLAGFTTQAQFLLGSDLGLAPAGGGPGALQEAAALKTLLLPGEMGERFKVMLLCRGSERLPAPLPGRDFRNRL